MKKSKLKLLVICIVTFGILSMFFNKAEAAEYDIKYDSKSSTSKTLNPTISYSRPSNLKGVTNTLFYLKNRDGVFCMDHSKSLSQWGPTFNSNPIDVTSECQTINYILGCQKPIKSGNNYKYSLAQNYIWKYAKDINVLKNYTTGRSVAKTFDYEKLKNANKVYEDYERKISDGVTVATIEKQNNSYNTKIKWNSGWENVKIGTFKMNDYTYSYSSDCAYVNNKVKYNKYSNSSKRAGVLAGIVDATVTIYTNSNKTAELTHSNGDFSFVYDKDRKEKYKYTLYPLPNETFYIRINKEKYLKDFGKKDLKVVINFKYIRVKANNISKATIYKCDNEKYQPLLCVAAGMNTNMWTKKFVYKYKATTVSPDVSLKVYATTVKNGDEISKNPLQYRKNEKDENGYNRMGTLNRSTMTTKKADRFLMEPGAEMTFIAEIKNNINKTTIIDGITLSGNKCFSNVAGKYANGVDQLTKFRKDNFLDENPTTTITLNYGKNTHEVKAYSVPENPNNTYWEYKLYGSQTGSSEDKMYGSTKLKLNPNEKVTFTIKTKDFCINETQGLIISLDKYYIADNTKTVIKNTKDSDWWYNKNHYVTIDKYIDKVDEMPASISVSRPTTNASDGYDDGWQKDNIDITEETSKGEIETTDTDEDNEIENKYIEDDNNEEDFGDDLPLIYLSDELERTAEIPIEANKNITCYIVCQEGNSDQVVCYYHEETKQYYYFETGATYYINITNYIKETSGKKYFDIESYDKEVNLDELDINEPDDTKSDKIENITDYDTEESIKDDEKSDEKQIYLKCNEEGGIECSIEQNKKGGYNIYNKEDNSIIGYYKDQVYYDTDDDVIYVLEDANGYYVNIVVSSDKTYLASNSSGILHGEKAQDTYFYPVTQSDDPDNIVCYYHEGITKKNGSIYFIYDASSNTYDPVEAQRDNNGWYVDEDNVKKYDNRIYVECGDNGNVLVKEGNVYDQTGSMVVCTSRDGKFYYKDIALDKEVEITMHVENGCYYVETDDFNIEGDSQKNSIDPSGKISTKNSTRTEFPNESKKNNPVEVKNGNIIEYSIVVYDTVKMDSALGITERKQSPWGEPLGVYVDVLDTLPKYIEKKAINYTYTYSDGKESKTGTIDYSDTITFENIRVPAGGYTIISYKVTISYTGTEEIREENKATLSKITNVNGVTIAFQNQDGEIVSSENDSYYDQNGNYVSNKEGNRVIRNRSDPKYRTSSDWFKYAYTPIEEPAEPEGTLYITNVQHSTNDNTFVGKAKTTYVESGDKVEYALDMKHENVLIDGKNYYYNDTNSMYADTEKKLQSIDISMKIDFPDDIHSENGNYKVLIDGKPYDVPSSQRDGFTYKYTLQSGDSKITEEQNYSDSYYPYIERVNCTDRQGSCWRKHIYYRKITIKNTIKVEVIVDGENAGKSYSLSASVENIKYNFSASDKKWYGPIKDFHKEEDYYIRDEDGNITYTVYKTWSDDNTYLFNQYSNSNPSEYASNLPLNLGTATYTISGYKMDLDEYICDYNAEMAKYNDNNGFTTGEKSQEFHNGTTSYNSTNNALPVEKYETLTFATKITNTISEGEEENNTSSSGKYKTRIRPQQVTQKIAAGLDIQKIEIALDGESDKLQERNNIINVTRNNNTITYDWKNYDKILSPGQSVIYYVTVKVKESNMSLTNLETNAVINSATNINHQKTSGICGNRHDRYIPDASVAGNKKDQDYVKLKDLVIAGKVWLDDNRDGKMGDSETKKAETIVNLYQNDEFYRKTKTNSNGQYTFGRVPKANGNNYYNYYVEFEYDGVKYKATEVYGGDNDGNADGMHALTSGGKADKAKWRRGNGDLPDHKEGDENYLIDSNAYEFDDVRNTFDNARATIGYNKTYDGTTPKTDLSYNKNGHVSTLNEKIENNIMTARSFIEQKYEGSTSSTNPDDTHPLFLSQYAGYSNQDPETEYLKYINLGLVEREKVDLSIEADVYNVKTQINGEEMTYKFGDNTADSSLDSYNTHDNAYKLKNAYNLSLYQADYNYRFDKNRYTNTTENNTNYNVEGNIQSYKGKESELETQVTYKIKIHNKKNTNDEPNLDKNNDIPIEAAINEMAIYYDSKYMKFNNALLTFNTQEKNTDTGLFQIKQNQKIDARYRTDNGAQLSINETSNYEDLDNNLNGQYNVLYLRGDNAGGMGTDYIKEGGSREIYITFTIDKDNARNMNLGDFKMIAEISAYTTKYGDNKHKGLAGQKAGLVDVDSNPGNLDGVENYGDFEDDTYKANIYINVPGKDGDTPPPPDNPPKDPPPTDPLKRSITGMVWDDARSETYGDASSGIQYLGNGEYVPGQRNNSTAKTNPKDTGIRNDKPIEGVKVTLIEVVQTPGGKYYEYPARDSQGKIITAKSDGNGTYTLNDYIPGYYKVRFDYGYDKGNSNNIIYNGQDYKSTAYYDKNYSGINDNIGAQGNYGYFDEVKDALNTEKKSDARDDEIRRLNVNSYSETMTASEAKIFAEIGERNYQYPDALTKNTWMYAESTIFYTKPEEVKSEETTIKATQDDFNNIRLWNIHNLDFGLEYRPEASIILDKNIESLELVTSDNKPLVKLYFKEKNGKMVIDEEKSVGNENVQFVPNNVKKEQGFVYINMDTDILEGCTIKLEYKMDAKNNSEVDRINENLYNIRYEKGAIDKGYTTNKIYKSNNYSANGTAAAFLQGQYYDGYNFDSSTGKEQFNYLTKIKKTYSESGWLDSCVKGCNYYGMYLGQTYYKGTTENTGRDKVAQLKVDHILDYIDNDFTFKLEDNKTLNRVWSTTTSSELKNVLDWEKVNHEGDNLIDRFGIKYDTDNRTNLALSVNDNKNGQYGDDNNRKTGNSSLSRFLETVKANNNNNNNNNKENYTGTISAVASKVVSADDISLGKGLSYENLAEVVQYTSLTGRRTTLPDSAGGGGVIGNASTSDWKGYNEFEDDTDATEVITISPPTGLMN